MEANLEPQPLHGFDYHRFTTREALFAAAVALGPALLFWHLRGLWNPDGDYAYGWVVPLLAAFLCKYRWDDRPAPSAAVESAAFAALGFALVTLPARWLEEAAPERSICAWSYAIATVGCSLALISLAGGFPWLKWFRFPFAFTLTAVPWPHRLEVVVSDFLMRGTAAATVEILCLTGVPSAQAGNLVQIEPGVIDIDEACSGIRSLQAMVMISLFLGELFRLTPRRRMGLIAAGLAITLLANVFRTVVLSGIASGQGMSAVDRYHDAAGFAVLAFSLSATSLMAYLLRPSRTPATAPLSARAGGKLPLALSVALLAWFCIEEASVEAWYRLHEPKWRGWSWSVEWPRSSDGFHFIDIPGRSVRLLMCDESYAAAWKEPDGSDWTLYWVRWNPGNLAAEAAKVHRPDVCLNAEGAIMQSDMGAQTSSVGALRIPFHGYTFLLGDKTLYVFFSLYEERPGGHVDPRFEAVGMLQRALRGERRIGEQSLELALSGYPSERSALEAFNARLGQLVKVSANAPPAAKE